MDTKKTRWASDDILNDELRALTDKLMDKWMDGWVDAWVDGWEWGWTKPSTGDSLRRKTEKIIL